MTRIEAFEVLGLKATASLEDIKNAYSELSKDCHPEENPERFNELHEAFSYLYRSSRRDARRRAILEEINNSTAATDIEENEYTEEESDSDVKDTREQQISYKIHDDTEHSKYSIDLMTGLSENSREDRFSESARVPEKDEYTESNIDLEKNEYIKLDNDLKNGEHDRVIYRLREDIGDELDLKSDRKFFQEKIRETDAFNEEKQRDSLAEEAIKHARQLYNKALNDPIRNSYSCMNELFKVYDKDVYESKRFLDELAVILSDKRLDNSIHKKVAEFYGFIGLAGTFITKIPPKQLGLFKAVKERWTPIRDNSLFMLFLGFFILIELAFIIIRGIPNKVISSALLVILIFGFVINEDFSSKHKHGFRREFVTVIMSVLALVIYFIGKALGTFDGIKMSNSQKSAWGTAIMLILGGTIIWSLFMYYRNVRSRNLI